VSQALARKYRPTSFDALIGQESVSQTLSLALDGDRLSHAYLFSGLRGSGKTSTARIFAKALLCEKGTNANPCEKCAHCVMASESRHMDIIEMDAASNRGIDDIKDLIEHSKYKPSSARYKIFIIDEVHMLTNQAFNALLKTLEEPPSFVKFILATTDPLKLPATILSRTQHFRFKKIPQNLILKHLEHILTLENVGFEEDALDIIARSGGGSLRDALTLTDQAIVYSKNFINIETVTGMLGIIEPSHLKNLIDNILKEDREQILDFIILAKNYEAQMILDELTLYLKSLLLSKDMSLSPMIIERFFRVIAESKSLLALGSDGEFVLSLALFKMIESLKIKEIDQMIRSLENELKGIDFSPKEVITKEIIKEEVKEEALIPKSPIQEEIIQKEIQTDSHQKTFDKLLEKIYDRNYNLGECFEKNISFKSFEDHTLTWESTAIDADKKSLITHWGLVKMFAKDCFGFETKIVNIPQVSIQKETLPEAILPQKIDEAQMKSSCIAPEAGETESAKEKDPSTLLQEPMIKEAIALLDPRKVRIKRNS
jgi:DNA polymerase-3 subunit gamma/tau